MICLDKEGNKDVGGKRKDGSEAITWLGEVQNVRKVKGT